jgi:glycerol-3-phosphate dehydrogenase
MSLLETEILVVGGGVLGCAIARELSRYKVDVTLIEQKPDLGWGVTKANAGIVCQGKDTLEFRPEYHRSRLLWNSLPKMEPLCRELGVPFQTIGGLEACKNLEQKGKLDKLLKRTEKLGLGKDEFHWRPELLELEPNLAPEILGGVYDPEIAITDPIKLTIALGENARSNGVKVLLNCSAEAIRQKGFEFLVRTNQGEIKTRYLVNAAGESIDKIARMVGGDDFVLFPIKGLIGILDKKLAGLVTHLVAVLPEQPGALNIISPTVNGNLLFGIPIQINRKGDYSATKEMQGVALRNLRGIIPDISEKDVITFFSGFLMMQNFEIGWHECVVKMSSLVPGLLNVSIGYPGVSAAPGVAEEVVEILKKDGVKLEPDPEFNPEVEPIPDFSALDDEAREKLIKQDPRHGHIICRCETVSEGEIVEAIKRGATTMDGVKYRTRAGMGRCQGGFCGPRVMQILARELNLPLTEIRKRETGSGVMLYESKELIKGRRAS